MKSAVTFLDGAARCAPARQDKLVSRPVAAGRSPRSPAALIALRAALTLTQSECSTHKEYLDKVDVVLVNCPMLARTSHPSPFPPITSMQPPHYHEITHSFAQRQPSIPSIFNSFRTLSIATEVVSPSLSKSRGVSFCGLCAPISVPSVLRFFPHLLAVICATWRRYPLWTHSIAHTSCRHRGAPQPSHFLRMPAFGYNPFALPPSPAGKDTAGSPAGSQSNYERCNRDA